MFVRRLVIYGSKLKGVQSVVYIEGPLWHAVTGDI